MKIARSLLKLSLFATLLTGFTQSMNPGLRAIVTAKGLEYVCQVGLPILEQELNSVRIPDISDSYSLAVVGKLDYTLSDIKLNSLKIKNAELKSVGTGMAITSSGISISGSAQWHYKKHNWPHISDSGSCTVRVTDTSANISMIVGKDTNGHATLNTTGCSISVGGLNVTFQGGTSWLYNLFEKSIAGGMKKSLNKQICKQATKAISSRGNKTLDSLPVVLKLGNDVEIDYSLLQNPVFTPTYVEISFKGEFLSISHPKEASLSPSSLPTVVTTDKMVYVWVTEYIANTAGLVYQSAGMLTYAITRDLIAKIIPINLNTSLFKTILPQLYKAFPDMDMELVLNATEPPVLKLVPNSANFNITGTVDVFVIQPDKTVAEAFALGVTLYADVEVFLYSDGSKPMIGANATLIRADMSLSTSKIGEFNVTVLQESVNMLASLFVIPALNYYGNIGIAIPVVEGMTFINPDLKLCEGYAMIGTDIRYQ